MAIFIILVAMTTKKLIFIANFFNLSAYLNTNRPNGTALTFVPLITLILGKLNLGTVG